MSACRRELALFLLINTIVFPCTGRASQGLERFEYSEIVMGMEARIVLYCPDEAAGRRAARGAFDRLADLDGIMSDYRPDSELARVCRRAGPGRGPVPVSDDLGRVLEQARAVSAASDGAFDVTVGPLAQLWRRARRAGELPDPGAIDAARARVGWRSVLVDTKSGTLELTRPDMQLDLGGIGKGFAAGEAVELLARSGVSRCLVDLGGDIAAGDPPPGADGWRVAIASRPRHTLTIARQAVAMSGDTEQYLEVDGIRYSHIIDPRSGVGLTNRTAVAVIGPEAATADALASAISVLGADEGLALLEQFPGTSAFVETVVGDNVHGVSSDLFPLAAAALGAAGVSDDQDRPLRGRKVLLIGIDGFRPDVLPVSRTPNLDRLIDDGCYTDRAATTEVTVSGPAWSSFLTGVWPDKHGVQDNTFEGADYVTYPHFFARLQEARPDAFTVSALDWIPLDQYIVATARADVRFVWDYEDDGDVKVVSAAVEALTDHDPDIVFVYFADLDVAGHEHGYHLGAPGYVAELEEIDGQVGHLIDAVHRRPTFADEDWLILVGSDHGGTIDGSHGRDIPLHRNVPLIVSGPSAGRGRLHTTANVVDLAVTALAHLGVEADPAWGLDGRPVGLGTSTQFGTNLIFNGDAEYGGGYNDVTRNAGIAGWTDTGAMTVIRYGAPEGFPGIDAPGPAQRGRCFFCGGKENVSAIHQVIDVADIAAEIDTGRVVFALTGWFGGFSDQRDLASLTARFLDERGAQLQAVTIGHVTVQDRRAAFGGDGDERTGFLPKAAGGGLPVGTRRIEVRLIAEAGTGDNDGYADNLSLVLQHRR
ncbi:MAG: FAD:protein FMN transferase [Planctomycetota bacterium]|jgi:thiamine biosynthesis lipoprotein